MRRTVISDLIDGKIIQMLESGATFDEIYNHLIAKGQRFTSILSNQLPENTDIKEVMNSELPEPDYKDFSNNKIRYCVFYIKQCYHRADEVQWFMKNRLRFYKYDDKKIFNLIKFRERISPEPSPPVII